MSTIDDNLEQFRKGLDTVALAIESIANLPPQKPEILDRGLSGNKIHAGMITKFQSVGIEDLSSKKSLTVTDAGIKTPSIETNRLLSDVAVDGNLKVNGNITAEKLHVNEITADVRNERTSPLEFVSADNKVYGKGLHWKTQEGTKQLIYRANPDRLWTSESLDLSDGQSYKISNTDVLSLKTLGPSVRTSSLTKVGTLNELHTQGDLSIDGYIFYNSTSESLGLGTESPNGKFSVTTLDGEFIIDIDSEGTKIGNWTTDSLQFITDGTVRATIQPNGVVEFKNKVVVKDKLGVGVKNVDADISIATAGPVKFQDKKFEVGAMIPKNGTYKKGDVVWNENPQPTGYAGWICIQSGTPGEWRPFGQISK